ncbi:MAG: hypothetical protein D6730_14605 [Bacteroidetes bacterium]|nr:MAG: hypothetical protein D6730_14605 [Bacteroidota bacterium]
MEDARQFLVVVPLQTYSNSPTREVAKCMQLRILLGYIQFSIKNNFDTYLVIFCFYMVENIELIN